MPLITSDSGCCPFCSYSFLPSFLTGGIGTWHCLWFSDEKQSCLTTPPPFLFLNKQKTLGFLSFSFFYALVPTFCKAFGDFYFPPWERKTSNRHVPGKIFERERKETSRKNSSITSTCERKKEKKRRTWYF